MPRTRAENRSNGELHKLPDRAAERQQTSQLLYSYSQGYGAIAELCLRHGVYVGLQAGSDGDVVGITVLDGAWKRRAWCHSRGDLDKVYMALIQRLQPELSAGTHTGDAKGRDGEPQNWGNLAEEVWELLRA